MTEQATIPYEAVQQQAAEVHTRCVEAGWWDRYIDCKDDRGFECLAFIVSELGEAVEANRKDLMDDHLPHFFGEDVEWADATIRALDYMGAREYDEYYLPEVAQSHYRIGVAAGLRWQGRPFVDRIFFLSTMLSAPQATLVGALIHSHVDPEMLWYSYIPEKLEYNRTRFDHTLEARMAPGGKKY
jgi:hypothetical protein